jgi:hypothetical protein
VPPSVDVIDGAAFVGSDVREIRVSEENRHFRVSAHFLLSADGGSLFRYFGRAPTVTLGREIAVLGPRSFGLSHLKRVRSCVGLTHRSSPTVASARFSFRLLWVRLTG